MQEVYSPDILKIHIPYIDGWDNRTEQFVKYEPCDLYLKHSLVSLQKWESKYKKAYLSDEQKTEEEIIDYIRFMTIKPYNVDPNIYYFIPNDEMKRISEHITDPMTATTFSSARGMGSSGGRKEIVTAEVIFWWMIELGIPIEFKKWHLNQLMTLIRVCEVKSGDQKKMNRNDILASNKALNAKRRAAMHTRG